MYDHNFVPDQNVYPMRLNSPEEEQMREGFIAIANDIVGQEENYQQGNETFLAGIELELPLVNDDYTLASQEARDAVIKATPNTSVELSAHQLEVVPNEPADLMLDLMSLEQAMSDSVSKVKRATRSMDLAWMRIGSYPLCHVREVGHTQGEPKYAKYERSPTWHTDNQRPDAEGYVLTAAGPLDVSSGYIVGLMSAVQVTVDALSFDDAFDKLNRSFMISPMAVALAANASHLGYLYTGYADVRFVSWEISHDTRSHEEVRRGFPTRVGLPHRYFDGMNEYFNQILSYPFVMNDPISLQHPFEVGNGIFWRDVRLKFFRDSQKLGVEFRPVAIQPTLHEDVAMMMFYIGRLLWSQKVKENLMPMDLVRQNKESVMRRGMQAKLHTQHNDTISVLPASEALAIEIKRAEEGLTLLEADPDKRLYYVNSWLQRVSTGSPAEVFIESSRKKLARNFEDARNNLIESIEELNLVER